MERSKRTPAWFKKVVKKVVRLDTPEIHEEWLVGSHPGQRGKYLSVVLFERGKPGSPGACKVRVDCAKGDVEVFIFQQDRQYHAPMTWTPADLRNLSIATDLAAKIVEEFYGSGS